MQEVWKFTCCQISFITGIRFTCQKTIQANLLAVEEGDEFEISHKYTVRAYKTFHRVPSLGYVVYKRQKSLKHEFINLSSAEIADIAKQGIDVNSININPEIAYTGDTRMELFHLKGCSHDGTKNDFLEAQVLITEVRLVIFYSAEKYDAICNKLGDVYR